MDDRPLVTVTASRIGNVWALRAETTGAVANGLYLMIPIESLEQAADVCMDIGQGIAVRTVSDRGNEHGSE